MSCDKINNTMESEKESDNEKNISLESDSSYVPSDETLESIGNSPEEHKKKDKGKKRTVKKKVASQAPQLKKQKTDRPPIKNKNYNEFFKNVHNFPEKSSGSSAEMAKNAETVTVEDDSSNSIHNSQHISGQNYVVVEEDLIQSMRDEIVEQKNAIFGMRRQLARIETLIKFQKESASDSTDGHPEKDSCIEILQSHGLPITSKEKLDEIEQNLKAVDFKTKLVCSTLD